MKRYLAAFLVLTAGTHLATAQPPEATPYDNAAPAVNTTAPIAAAGNASVAPKPAKTPKSHPPPTAQTLAQMQASLDELTKSNHDLLDLLKQQQAVLEDIQYDRRLQSRQIQSLEERLEEALTERQQLQDKVDRLELQADSKPVVATAPGAVVAPPNPTAPGPPDSTPSPIATPTVADVTPPDSTVPTSDATGSQPASYLPPEGADNPPGQQGWHRLFTLKGTDNQQTPVFLVHGKLWRVLWHNQDKDGKLYANTSALFISAFPRDDTIPEKVCSKLGTGGDSAELQGPGNYYLKIEASGGSWELAVEDFR
jgi:hypothetical protein